MWGYPYWVAYILRRVFFSHRSHWFNRPFLRTVSISQKASGIQNSQSVTAKDGCKVLWNRLTYCLCAPLCVLFFCILCEKKNNCETHWGGISLTDLTDLTDPFCAQFRFHRTPPAYRFHRTFQLTSAITFCDICRLLADVCVFSLFAERLLSLCETLWEIEYTTNQDVCRKASVPLWKSVRNKTRYD